MDARSGYKREDGHVRSVYVISDLHLGGDYPEPREPGKRGYRLCTRTDAVGNAALIVSASLSRKRGNSLATRHDLAGAVSAFDKTTKSKLVNRAVTGAPENQLHATLETLMNDLR